MKRIFFKILKVIIGLYFVACGLLYFFQENLIFFPQELPNNYKFNFEGEFTELNIKTDDGKFLNGLLFKAKKAKGLIFYLHGNSGSVFSWGNVANTYTDLGYDIFILDYRGFGKSEGAINKEEQLFADNQRAYDVLKKEYEEKNIIILGYSIGTGLATQLASVNSPKKLILQAPYYNLTDMMQNTYPFVPSILLKYKFKTNSYIRNCNMPITIFHGNADSVIYYGSSIKLKNENVKIELITLKNQGHNGITNNVDYQKQIQRVLDL